MKNNFTAICTNPFRDTGCALAQKTAELLGQNGFETCICPIFAENADDVLPKGLITTELQKGADRCGFIVVIGGDGTLLSVARQIKGRSIPIIGVNLGSMGFMALLEPDELDYVLKAAQGGGKLSRRMKIDVSVIRGGDIIYTDCALNDVVVHGYGECINVTAQCNGDNITAFSGDGIILSTPTGSTGYSMSAGGPIVEPDAQNIIISPICAHMMSSRSFVLGPDREVDVYIRKLHGRRAYLSVDGNSVLDIANRDIVHVRRSESVTLMADMGLRNFYEIAFDKLTGKL